MLLDVIRNTKANNTPIACLLNFAARFEPLCLLLGRFLGDHVRELTLKVRDNQYNYNPKRFPQPDLCPEG